MEFFYDISLTEKDKISILGLKEYIVSPAEMGKIMFENFDNFRNAIDKLEKICKENEKEEIYIPFIENEVKNRTKEQSRENLLNILGEENMKRIDETNDEFSNSNKNIILPEEQEQQKKNGEATYISKPDLLVPYPDKPYGVNDSLQALDKFSSALSVY
jgi:hypothetical protein